MDEAAWRSELEAARQEKDAYFQEEFIPSMGPQAADFHGLKFTRPPGLPGHSAAGAGRRGAAATGDFHRGGADHAALWPPGLHPRRPGVSPDRLSRATRQRRRGRTRSLSLSATPPRPTKPTARDAILISTSTRAQTSTCSTLTRPTIPSAPDSPYFSCPYPPPENHLTIPIRAGERYSG